MLLAVVCRKCGHERTLTIFEIRSGTWKRRPCDVCGHIEPSNNDESKREPTSAA
jgi:hypothetical protein